VALQVVGGPQFWPRLTRLLGRPELAQDPRFATREARRENRAAVEAIVGEWLLRFGAVEDAVEALRAARVPCAVVLTPEEVVAHPHLAAREAFPAVRHPARGSVRISNTPFKLSSGPTGPAGNAPYRPGEDSVAVLSGLLGYSEEAIERLARAGAVALPP
jgi:crotonobetainyl-CoA:carnitine CoA-transferase CaiB-like acyl-CoA transferase